MNKNPKNELGLTMDLVRNLTDYKITSSDKYVYVTDEDSRKKFNKSDIDLDKKIRNYVGVELKEVGVRKGGFSKDNYYEDFK